MEASWNNTAVTAASTAATRGGADDAVDDGPRKHEHVPRHVDLVHQGLHCREVRHAWISSIQCPELDDGGRHGEAQRQELGRLHHGELHPDLLHPVP
jgi:hypothetical protein